jgi:hypothetical protein
VIALVFWSLLVLGGAIGLGFGWSAGYVRGLHVGHDRGMSDAHDFDVRWRAQLKEWDRQNTASR